MSKGDNNNPTLISQKPSSEINLRLMIIFFPLVFQLFIEINNPKRQSRHEESCFWGKSMCYDEVTQGSTLRPLPISNYPYVGRMGLQAGVGVATQGAIICSDPITDYHQYSSPNKECG